MLVPPSQVKTGEGTPGNPPCPGQVPCQDGGYPYSRLGLGCPHPRSGQVRVPLGTPLSRSGSMSGLGGGGHPNRNSTACTCFYEAGGMPLAFMQKEFLVIVIWFRNARRPSWSLVRGRLVLFLKQRKVNQ